MSDEKDPVREQIERDAKKSALAIYPNEDSLIHNTYGMGLLDGAIDQDPIAWNRCIEAVITMISIRQDGAYGDSEYSELDRLKKDLEKLRR